MKKLFISIIAVATLCSCGGNNGYVITGTVTPETGDSVYLLASSGDHAVLASAAVGKEGKFVLTGKTEQPVIAFVANGNKQPIAMLFLENGKIAVDPSAEAEGQYIITGTPANDNFRPINDSLSAIQKEFYEMGDSITDEQAQALQDKYGQILNNAVANNTGNLLGVYIFSQTFSDLEPAEAQAQMEKFTPEMKATEMMTEIKKSIDAKVNTEIGKPYINITAQDANGQAVALSSLVGEGKWVLVDFWATWCGPCRMEIPHLVAAYKAFADKGFVIYGVSLDSDKEAWLKFMPENEMTWTNVIDLKEDGKDQAADAYGIRSIPSNFLISPEGVIVAKNLRGDDVMTKLQEFIK